jgi:hypothetical protein
LHGRKSERQTTILSRYSGLARWRYRVSATEDTSTLAGPLADSAVHDRDMMGIGNSQ